MKYLILVLTLVLVACGSEQGTGNGASSGGSASSCKGLQSYWAFQDGSALDLRLAKFNDTMQVQGFVPDGMGTTYTCFYNASVYGTEGSGLIALQVHPVEVKPICGNLNGDYDYVKGCATVQVCKRVNAGCVNGQ